MRRQPVNPRCVMRLFTPIRAIWIGAPLLLLFGVAAAAAAPAQNEPAQDEPAHTQLSGQIEIARLVDLAAQRMRINCEYDPAALQGTVTLRVGEQLSDDELWALTNRALAARGFTTVRRANDDAISIVKMNEAAGLAAVEIHSPSANNTAAPGFANVVLKIESAPVKAVIEAVKPLLSKPAGAIVDLGAGGLVLVSDLQPRVEEIRRLIAHLDGQSSLPAIETIELKFANGVEVASLATAAAAAHDAVAATPMRGKIIALDNASSVTLICPPAELQRWTELIRAFDMGQPVETRTYAPRHFAISQVAALVEQAVGRRADASNGSWRMVVDELTGTLIVTATSTEHEQVASLLNRLDNVEPAARRPIRSFSIRNRKASEILDILSRLIEAGVLSADSAPPPTSRTSTDRMQSERAPRGAHGDRTIINPPAGQSSVAPQAAHPSASEAPTSAADGGPIPSSATASPAFTLTCDEGTNTLIAMGDARTLTQIEQLLRILDVRQPQVMLEVMIVSLSDADTLDLGVELQKIEISGSTIISLASLFGLTAAPNPALATTLPPGGRGGSGVLLSPGDFSVVVRALRTVNAGRTMSLPKVLVNNNQQATLDSVIQQPFASTNASDTVATTSFGGSENAGTIVTIKPQIAQGDHLILEYSISLSSFIGAASDPRLPPPKQSNNLSSIVTIPDGYTIVVGGLEITSDADAESKVPLLGDIPALGEAFKNRSRSQSRTRFFVFIRSEVLRHEHFEDLKYLSEREVVASGVGEAIDDWPEVKPRIIR